MNRRTTLLVAGILGGTGVALGAFGAHALKETLLERGMAGVWDTATKYQLYHALAFLALGPWIARGVERPTRALDWAARCWLIGTVLFSGSLYALALGAPRWAGPITPLGGVFLLAGWACVIAAAFSRSE